MPAQADLPRTNANPELGSDFTRRLEVALESADHERRRLVALRRVRACLPLLLLIIPVAGWHLMLASPDGVHVSIDALAWLTFLLDVGVHVDSALLSYLGLQALPSILGGLLLLLTTVWLLSSPGQEE